MRRPVYRHWSRAMSGRYAGDKIDRGSRITGSSDVYAVMVSHSVLVHVDWSAPTANLDSGDLAVCASCVSAVRTACVSDIQV